MDYVLGSVKLRLNICIAFNINRVTYIRHSLNIHTAFHAPFIQASWSIVAKPAVDIHNVENLENHISTFCRNANGLHVFCFVVPEI
jgi:hypothetical protein